MPEFGRNAIRQCGPDGFLQHRCTMITALRFLAALTFALYFSSAAAAADLAKLERTLVKEPGYRSKPRYCLLVFGQDAKTRVWLVQDGDTLYVDRNGNGDLTEAGEKVAAKANKRRAPEEGVYDFEAGEIAEGPLVHRALRCSILKIDDLADTDENVKALLSEHPDARVHGRLRYRDARAHGTPDSADASSRGRVFAT